MGLHKLLYNLHRGCKLSVKKDSESDSTSIPLGSTPKQAIGVGIARTKQSLLKSTSLKVKILSTLVKSLSSRSKSSIFDSARKSFSFKKQGGKTVDTSQLVSFWKSLQLALVLQGVKKTLSAWAEQMKKVFSSESMTYFTTYESQWLCAMRSIRKWKQHTTKCIPLLQRMMSDFAAQKSK